jgi:hypothetical protein
VVALQQRVLLPDLPASSSKGASEPQAVQVVLQVPAGASIPAANTAEVRGVVAHVWKHLSWCIRRLHNKWPAGTDAVFVAHV